MDSESSPEVPRWLWYTVVGALALAVATALALIVALALGWNNPRPSGPPDWDADGLPRRLEAPPDSTVVDLLGYPDSVPDDFILEGTMAAVSGPDFNGYGLAYRALDADRYTVFAVGSDGYYGVLRVESDDMTALVEWQQFPHIRRGAQTNRLRVACSGRSCDFYINDEYAASVEDDSWLHGDFGLWVRSFEEEVVAVEFDAVRVWEP